jgi:hypothetical protein
MDVPQAVRDKMNDARIVAIVIMPMPYPHRAAADDVCSL